MSLRLHGAAAELALEDRERALKQLLGIVVAAGGIKDRRERGAIRRGGGMIVAERGSSDGHGRAGRGLAVGGPAASVREPADVVQDHADVRVRWPEPRDEDGVDPVVQCGRLVESARVLEHDAEVVSKPCRTEVVARQVALGDDRAWR